MLNDASSVHGKMRPRTKPRPLLPGRRPADAVWRLGRNFVVGTDWDLRAHTARLVLVFPGGPIGTVPENRAKTQARLRRIDDSQA